MDLTADIEITPLRFLGPVMVERTYTMGALEALVVEFWTQVDVGGPACWEFQGRKDKNGYGLLRGGGLAHRRALEFVVGPLRSACVLHRCDNPPCCRPSDLRSGTRADNVADMVAKGRDRVHDLRGEQIATSKLTEANVLDIIALLGAGERQTDIALRFGVTQTNISRIARRQTWRHLWN